MLGPSKQKNLIIGHGFIAQNPYPANETVNLSLSNCSSSLTIFAPLVLPQQNVLLVKKKMSETRKGGFDLGLPKPKDLILPPSHAPNASEQSNEKLDGAGTSSVVEQEKLENLFLHPIKV